MTASRSRPWMVGLTVGVLAGALLTAGVVSAQRRGAPAPKPAAEAASFELYDTPGSTFMLNKTSGEVWRISFTEVRGERHWFGAQVPMQPQTDFDTLQKRLHQKLGKGGT